VLGIYLGAFFVSIYIHWHENCKVVHGRDRALIRTGGGLDMAYRRDRKRPARYEFPIVPQHYTMTLRRWLMRLCTHPAASVVSARRQQFTRAPSTAQRPSRPSKTHGSYHWAFERPSVCVVAAPDRGSMCDVWHGAPRPRRSLGSRARDAQSPRGKAASRTA
jgi:hypothetical protein